MLLSEPPADVDGDLWQEVDAVLPRHGTAAVYAVVHPVVGPCEVGTALHVDAESAAEVPGISAEGSCADDVALDAVVASVAEHSKVSHLEVGEVIVHPQCIVTVVPSAPRCSCRPLAAIEVDAEVAVLALSRVVGGPWTESAGDTESPRTVEACLKTEIGCQRGGIDKIIPHGELLRPHGNLKHESHKAELCYAMFYDGIHCNHNLYFI